MPQPVTPRRLPVLLLAGTALASASLPGGARAAGDAGMGGAPQEGVAGARVDTGILPVELPGVEVQADATVASTTRGYVAHRDTTGTKTDTPITETPQSISVVTRDQINQQDAETLNAAVRYTSGVVPEQRGAVATRYDQLTIRGFDANFYFNGLRLRDNGEYLVPQLDPWLMDRVEVLKGPASILYGASAAGGLINQVQRLPTEQGYHVAGIEFGNFGHVQGEYASAGRIDAAGHWLYSLAAIGRTEQGQVRTTRNERVAVAPAVTWTPDEATRLTVTALYQHDPRASAYGTVPPEGSALANPLGSIPQNYYDGDTNFEKFDRTQVSLGYQFLHEVNAALTLRSNGRWFHLQQDYASVYDNGLATNADGTPDYATVNRGTAASTGASDQYTIDNTAVLTARTGPVSHVALLGFDFQHISSSANSGFNFLDGTTPSQNLFNPNYQQPISQPARTKTDLNANQFGIYGQDQAKWGRFLLTGSLREDLADTQTRTATLVATQQSQYDTALSGRGALTYLFDNGVAPYVSYTQSFTPIVGSSLNGGAYKPETGQQYEVGVKYQPRGFNALFTGALFDLTRQNLLTADPNGVPGLQVQTGEARSRGAEVEAKVSLTASLNLVAAYTYLDTFYSKDNTGLQGQRVPAVPHNSASGWAYYTVPAGPAAGLAVGAGARYIGSTAAYGEAFKVRDYVLVDATLRYDLGRAVPKLSGAEMYVNAQNLLGNKYVASCYYAGWCAYGYQRQVFAGVTYRW